MLWIFQNIFMPFSWEMRNIFKHFQETFDTDSSCIMF